MDTIADNAGPRPRRPEQPEKTMKGVKVAGLSKPSKAEGMKPLGSTKPAGLSKPGKGAAKVGSSTRAEVAKKKSASAANVFGESS